MKRSKIETERRGNVRYLGPPTLMTMGEVCEGFAVVPMTIIKWREIKNFPYLVLRSDKRDSVRFDLPDVLEWARTHGYQFRVPARLRSFQDLAAARPASMPRQPIQRPMAQSA